MRPSSTSFQTAAHRASSFSSRRKPRKVCRFRDSAPALGAATRAADGRPRPAFERAGQRLWRAAVRRGERALARQVAGQWRALATRGKVPRPAHARGAACRKNSTTPASCQPMRRARRSMSGGHEPPAIFRIVGSAPANHFASSPLSSIERRSPASPRRICVLSRRASSEERWQFHSTALMQSGGNLTRSERVHAGSAASRMNCR